MTDDLGRLDRADPGGRHRLTFTRVLPHPPDRVWRAVTEPAHLTAWFPARIDGERRPGAPLRFVFEHGEGPPGDGVVLECRPPRGDEPGVFAFTWETETLRLELSAADGGTVLTLVDEFDELGKAARDGAGWHYCLELLGLDLAGQPPTEDALERWRTIHPAYVATFGPEASTLAPPETHPASG